jgi:phage terminase large subunit-like protein
MDFGILLVEMDAKVVNVIRLAHIILHATHTLVNVSVSQVSQDYNATNVKPIIMDSLRKDVKLVSVMQADQRVVNVTKMASVHVMQM